MCGFDYTFGKDRLGDINYLKELKKDRLIVIQERKLNDIKIGSFEIKKLLLEGSINEANEMLGREYSIKGFLYKRNKNYAITTGDYLIPRNGYYTLALKKDSNEITFEARTKYLKDESSLLIKDLNNSLSSLKIEKRKNYEIIFTKTSSKSL